MYVYLNDRENLNWKLIIGVSIFVIGGFYMMIDSDFPSGKTVIMETGDETFNNNNTIVAGDYEYTVTKIGIENTILEYGDFGDKIKANGKFIIFKISIKNNSNYPFSMDTINNTPFYLLNQKRLYQVNSDSSRNYTNSKTNGYGYWDSRNFINPGNESIGYAIFDVPKEIIKSGETQLLIPTDDSAPNDIYLNIN